MRIIAILSLVLLASCAQDEGAWPELAPLDGILEAEVVPAPTGDLAARAQGLQARAQALRGAVIAPGSLPNY